MRKILINSENDLSHFNYHKDKILKALDEFPVFYHSLDGRNDEFKIMFMIRCLNKQYKETKKELKGLFTENEAWALVDAYAGGLLEDTLLLEIATPKFKLLSFLEDVIHYGNPGFPEDIYKSLYKKVKELDEFKAFAVDRMIREFWICRKEYKNSQIAIRTIFNIEEKDWITDE